MAGQGSTTTTLLPSWSRRIKRWLCCKLFSICQCEWSYTIIGLYCWCSWHLTQSKNGREPSCRNWRCLCQAQRGMAHSCCWLTVTFCFIYPYLQPCAVTPYMFPYHLHHELSLWCDLCSTLMQYRIILKSYYCSIVFYLWHHLYVLCSHLYDSIVLCYIYKLDCNVVEVQFIITCV